MCEKGLNAEQFQFMIKQADDSLAMSQQWLEQLHHLADHAALKDASVALAQATVLLGQTRAKLENAVDVLDGAPSASVTVKRL